MKELKNLTANELARKLKNLVSVERKLTTEILWHLREVERRRLHLDWAYPSLFEYCVKDLGYSAGAAFRRISAMRLLKDLPEIEASLQSGKLNLSQVTQAQEYFRREEKAGQKVSKIEKLEMLNLLVGKSTRECERVITAKNPELSTPQEKVRVLSGELTEVRIVISSQLMNKLDRLKEIKSHIFPNPNYAELLEMLVDLELKKVDRTSAKPLPAPKTGKTCGSRFQIQIDHIVPFGKQGSSVGTNLRVFCATHNRHEARREYSQAKMAKYCD